MSQIRMTAGRPNSKFEIRSSKRRTRRVIAVVTGSRAEFGLLTPVMRAIGDSRKLTLRTIVTGLHLVQGTWRDVERAGFVIDAKVRMQMKGRSGRAADVAALARGVAGIGKSLADIRPDMVLVLGDRIEALAAASAASVGGFLLGHIHGGDRAEGVADEAIRHAVSKLAQVHFAATLRSRQRLIRMGEPAGLVFNVGSPAIDGLRDMPAADDEMIWSLGIDPTKPFAVVMQHPIGATAVQEEKWMTDTLRAVQATLPCVVLASNRDPGCEGIDRAIQAARLKAISHLPRGRFVGVLKRCAALVGNSSAGLIEASAVRRGGVPAVNIGPRQGGRERPGNVVDSPYGRRPVAAALGRALHHHRRTRHPYGDGHSGQRVARRLAGLPFAQIPLCKHNTY